MDVVKVFCYLLFENVYLFWEVFNFIGKLSEN